MLSRSHIVYPPRSDTSSKQHQLHNATQYKGKLLFIHTSRVDAVRGSHTRLCAKREALTDLLCSWTSSSRRSCSGLSSECYGGIGSINGYFRTRMRRASIFFQWICSRSSLWKPVNTCLLNISESPVVQNMVSGLIPLRRSPRRRRLSLPRSTH